MKLYGKYTKVRAIREFQVFRIDDWGDLYGVVSIPEGCNGIIEARNISETEEGKVVYDILFTEGDTYISAGVDEEHFALYLEVD